MVVAVVVTAIIIMMVVVVVATPTRKYLGDFFTGTRWTIRQRGTMATMIAIATATAIIIIIVVVILTRRLRRRQVGTNDGPDFAAQQRYGYDLLRLVTQLGQYGGHIGRIDQGTRVCLPQIPPLFLDRAECRQ